MIEVHHFILLDGLGFSCEGINRPGTGGPFLLNLDGWFGVEPRAERLERIGDGDFPATHHRAARKLTMRVWEEFATRPQAEERARQVSAAFGSGRVGDGTLLVDGVTGPLAAHGLSPDGPAKVELDWAERPRIVWELPMIAADPCLYGPVQRTQAVTRGFGEGLVYGLFHDVGGALTGVLEWGGQVDAGQALLVNEGNAPAAPVVTVTGEMPNGFTVTVAGGRITYTAPVSGGSPVRVDMAGSVTVDGADHAHQLSDRRWGLVEPGGSTWVVLTCPEGTGWADIELRSTYL